MARYAFALILLLVLVGCGGRCGKPENFALRSTALAYFGPFLDNSYWVYQCVEDTSVLDTITLHGRLHRIVELGSDSRCKPDYSEELSYLLIGGMESDTIRVWLSARRSDSFYMNGSFLGDQLYLYGDIEGDTDWFYVSDYWNDELVNHGSLAIGGITYEGVVQIKKPWGNPFPEQVPSFWLARGVGMIQFQLYDETLGEQRTYQLKEYLIQ
ncbi:MAG: hypothetical protein IPI00_04275 [Flavobacteriales bacterium]|nr:hypothetical protein [Flavobacteriales bacterium]MBK6945041.1 hypothetical protein [Flavobacteriales bacterium]MBK7239390.1 hypothetical protein [Flavobacteriales bacterium]MBK9535404.1 hypothetical protein [Flavobacteriales bacterium]MBP9137611.1 hypothetical protein [Flavobacteriales bacterium]